MSDKVKSPFAELMQNALTQYETALQAGLKLQQESSKWWNGILGPSAGSADWQKRWQQVASETMPLLQQRMEQSLKLLEQSSRTSLDLIKQAVETLGNQSLSQTQERLHDLGTASLEAMRDSAQAVVQANARVVDSYVRLFTQANEVAETKSAKK